MDPAVVVAGTPDLHDPGPGHPEAPGRLEAVLGAVRAAGITPVVAPPAERGELLAVHTDAYLNMLEARSQHGGGRLDPDTVMSAGSWAAAVGGAGAMVAAVRHALAGKGYAFAAVRPPGHHCLADRAMGFCLLANVVIGARAAQHAGCERILIVDWDVHHGNGTQALVENDPGVRFISLHEAPGWPGTGAATDRGVGNVFNLPRPPGLPPEVYVEDLWQTIVTATTGWTPDLVLLSAGFDSLRGDPLGGFTLEPGHVAEWGRRLRARWPDTPSAGVLEGGYLPDRLAAGVLAHLSAMG